MSSLIKKKIRRALAGILSVVSAFSLVGSPLMAYAAGSTNDSSALEAEVPELEDVLEKLDEDEIVTAEDIVVGYGSSFNPEEDFDGLSYKEEKVKITLHEAKSEIGYAFTTSRADIYQAVYYVEPVSGNPVYQISHVITVKEPESDCASAVSDEGSGREDSDDSDPDSQVSTAGSSIEVSTENAFASGSVTAADSSADVSAEAILEETESAGSESDTASVSEETSTESDTLAGLSESDTVVTAETAGDDQTDQASDTGTSAETDMNQESDETGAETEAVDTESGADGSTDTLESEMETETEESLDGGIMLLSLEEENTGSGLNENKSYVSGLAVKSLKDGTSPFDSDDEAGNDSGASNHIVRTFDYVNYTLEYTTALMDTSQTVDEAYMIVEFTLDCDPSKAEFNTDTLNWCVDRVITYVYADGTTSTSWDSSKTVTAQILTGKRYLSQNGDSNAIPGAGTLSVGIYVKAAQNGDVLQPAFTVWMEGNEESLYRTIQADSVQVSAEPRYNIALVRNGSCNYLGYFDTDAGTISATDTDGSVYGRLEGYALTLQLYNTSADKGLKGIELPAGNITFDLTLTETLDEKDVSTEEDYTPILWDYRENASASLDTVGKLGRQMVAGGALASAYGTHCQPWNSGGASDIRACYSGGSWSIAQDEGNGNVYHVTVSGYAFDLDNLSFPNTSCDNATENTYGANIGCFSAGYVEVVVQFARSVDTTSNLYFLVEAGNLAASSLSGQSTTTDQVASDNSSGMNVTLYPVGSISKRNHYNTTSYVNRASLWSSGDFYASQGEEILVVSVADFSGDGCLTSMNLLQKIDDEAFEVPAGTTTYSAISVRNTQSVVGTIRVLFAAKPDKTGWQSDAEMNAAREEELVYFESIDALNAAGYTCVGFLYEFRECSILRGSTDSAAIVIYMPVTVKDSASIGSVYQTTNDLRAWSTDADVISWTDFSYGSGAFGLGSSGWTEGVYVDGYTTPDYMLYTNYGKIVYENGNVVAGHAGGYIAGNSCLIIGCKTGVTIQVADTTTTTAGATTTKAVYDLDAGERTVTYVIHPSVSVVSANTEVESSTDTTDVTITAILPSDLSYVMNSASLAPVSVVENEDGTSTITWLVENQTIGEAMEDITLSCLIGEAGTANDVQNNDTLTIAATITSDKDDRSINTAHGNYSETTISVIKLATSSVSKAVESALVEEGDSITYIIRYGNSAEEDVDGVVLYDILPYNGDGRDTSFSGSYAVDSITVDFSNAKETYSTVKDSLEIRWTGSESARDTSLAETIIKGTDSLSWKTVSGASADGTTVIYSSLALSDVAGLLFDIGTVKAQEYLKITVTLTVQDGSGNFLTDANGLSQNPGDLYANSFYEYATGQVAMVESNTVAAQVVQRTVSGLAWVDADSDGIRGETEALFSGVTATLYRTNASGYASSKKAAVTVNGVKLYTAYDVLGNEVAAVTTGKDGSYQFTDLEAGTYYVVFSGMDGYGLTVQDAGEDDTVDSDATASVYEDGSGIAYAYISGITLPELDEMYAYFYESSHNDAGLIAFTSGFSLKKVEKGTATALSGAVFVLKNADGQYLTFENGIYSGTKEKVSAACKLTTGTDGTLAVDGLPFGTYTLVEYQAPDGYEVSAETWKIQILGKTSESGWVSYLTVDGETLDGELVIENEIAETSVTVEKAWKDNDNQDGLRTDVTVNLTGTVVNENGETVTVVTKYGTIRANAAKQEETFTGLPAYAYGKAVTYSVTEEEVAGYTASYSALDGTWEDGYRIVVTNTHTTETTEYTVSKVWDDDSNRDGVRPDSVEVKLIGSDGSERVARLAEDDGWNYTFTDLPVYWNEGTKIKYTLEESPVSDYVRAVSEADSENHFTVTNTHEIATIDIPVEKIWDDADDQDGVRTEEITVVLTGSDGTVREAVLTASGDWSYMFESLPVYWNEGVVITYSLQEKEVDGYSDEVIAGEDGYSFTVTNNHIPAVTDAVIVKAWDDDSNRDGIRPETIHVVLSGTDGGSYEADLTKENGYSHLFTGLPVYYNHGTTVVYSVSEDAVEGYETAVSADETGYIFTVTNTHEPATISIPVTKTWDDNDDQDGLRPESITVTLKASSGVSYGAELSAENGWAYTFEDVFVYYNEGELAEYSLEEITVDGYGTEIAAGEDGYSFELTNTHEPETTEVNVKKIWDDDDNRDGVRADFLHITLSGSDGKCYEADLTEETGWAAVITNLPVYFNHGEKIIYTIAEDDTANYEAELVTTEDGYGFTFTNTHEIAKTDITVTKTWEDAENQDGVRPDEVEVVLTGSDGSRYSAVLTEETDWTYTFTDLPVYWNKGEQINYSLQETAVDGYSDEILKGEDGYTFTVTNNHIPAVVDLVICKEWADYNDRDGIRPDSISVTLTGTDGSVYDLELTEEGGFVEILTGLPVYMNEGEEIIYTVTEEKVEGYESAIDTSADDYTFTIINSHMPKNIVIISKKDITNEEELAGASLVVKDEDGNIVDEWTSTEEGHTIAGLQSGTYTLTEVTAPDGYELAETITFEVVDSAEDQYVTMYDSPKEATVDLTGKSSTSSLSGSLTSSSVNTGDGFRYLPALLAMMAGAALLVAVALKKRKTA
ncbi:MAG: Cna B-type domain-containing protein [Lachnospiraceae bacterium]|nr:Cna B-type domain-containing protein [Lachnospiraceae bacterium]